MGLSRAGRGATGVAALLAVLALAPDLRAQTDSEKERAQKLFQEGRRAVARKDCPRAIQLFVESQALYHSRGTLFNLAQCEEQVGKLAEALTHYQGLAAELPERDDRTPVVQKRIAALDPRVPALSLALPKDGAPPPRVTLDGKEVAVEALVAGPLRMNPGKHALLVRWPGGEERLFPLDLAEGARETLTLTPPAPEPAPTAPVEAPAPPPPRPAPPPRPPPPGWSAGQVAGFVIGGLGLATLGGSAVTGALALDRQNKLEALCPEPSLCNDQGLAIASEGKSLATVSTITMGAGAGALVLGLVLVIATGPGEAEAPPVALEVLPAGGGLTVRGSF